MRALPMGALSFVVCCLALSCDAESRAAERLYLGKVGPDTVAVVSVLPAAATEVVRELCRSKFGAATIRVVRKSYRAALVDIRAGRPGGQSGAAGGRDHDLPPSR